MSGIEVVRRVAAGQDMLISAAQALQAGFSRSDIATRCRRGEWLAITRGVYLIDADLAGEVSRRMMWRAAILTHGPGFCLVATSGAAALGLEGLPRQQPIVEVAAVGGSSRAARPVPITGLPGMHASIVVRQLPVKPDEIEYVEGLAVRRASLTVVDAALVTDRATALALMDSALHQSLVTRDALVLSVGLAEHRPGIVAVRELASLADARAESQVESRVRLACIDGDVPPDDLQFPVRDEHGYLIAVGDMAWRRRSGRPLLAEADGRSIHELPEAVFRDRTRGNALVARSCDTVRFTYADTFKRGYIPAVIKQALRAA